MSECEDLRIRFSAVREERTLLEEYCDNYQEQATSMKNDNDDMKRELQESESLCEDWQKKYKVSGDMTKQRW